MAPSLPAPRIFIVDDDEDFRDSLCWLLDAHPAGVSTFASGEAFLENYQGEPGCLLLDIRMPGLSGLALQQELKRRHQRLPILVITGHGDIPMAVTAIKHGALDFIEKPFDDQLLLDKLEDALRLAQAWAEEDQQRQRLQEAWTSLSRREREVMAEVVAGQSNRCIAENLNISPKTVEVHRARVMSKMQASSLPELVRQWQQLSS